MYPRDYRSFYKLINEILNIKVLNYFALKHILEAKNDRQKVIQELIKLGIHMVGGYFDYNSIRGCNSIQELATVLSGIPGLRIDGKDYTKLNISDLSSPNYIGEKTGITDDQLDQYLWMFSSALETNNVLWPSNYPYEEKAKPAIPDYVITSLLVKYFTFEQNDHELAKFYQKLIRLLLKHDGIRLENYNINFEICEAFPSGNSVLKKIDHTFCGKLDDKKKMSLYQNITRETLLKLLLCDADIKKLFNNLQNKKYSSINDEEITSLLQGQPDIYCLTHDSNDQIFPLDNDSVYLYLPREQNRTCYLGCSFNDEYRFFPIFNFSSNPLHPLHPLHRTEIDIKSIERILTKYPFIYNAKLLYSWQHDPLFTWEKIRPPSEIKEDIISPSSWSKGLSSMYDTKVEAIYAKTIRPRILEKFKEILTSLDEKNKINIFEVGAGNGEMGLLCANYASENSYQTTLYPSDIHEENVKKIREQNQHTKFKIITDVVSSANLDLHLKKFNAVSSDRDISILVSSGCLCFNIIPGTIKQDILLIQKMHRYNINYLIADGLETPIINTKIVRDMYKIVSMENHGSPKEENSGFNICLRRLEQHVAIEKVENKKILNISFHSNPVRSLFNTLSQYDSLENIADIIDLRYAYLEREDYVKLPVLLKQLISANPKLAIVIDQDSDLVRHCKFKSNILIVEDNPQDDLSMMTNTTLSYKNVIDKLLNKRIEDKNGSTNKIRFNFQNYNQPTSAQTNASNALDEDNLDQSTHKKS